MLITANLDQLIEGTLNQDFDLITGADTINEAINVYVAELSSEDKKSLQSEVSRFLELDDVAIQQEFHDRYHNSFSQDDGKDLLLAIFHAIN